MALKSQKSRKARSKIPAVKKSATKPGRKVPRKVAKKPSKPTPVFARTIEELASELTKLRGNKGQIALVPTMGALHAGHLALIEKARDVAKHTVVSIFVNPQQFAQNEDLDSYPRDEVSDAKKLADANVDLVWAPEGGVMYKDNFATRVVPGGAAEGLESAFRPHFFAGVATVVMKLFNQVKPDFAVFGEKDYQQLCVVRQMVEDLNLLVEIIAVPTLREKDGLALSSRNSYLTKQQRSVAPALNRILLEFAKAVGKTGNTTSLRSDARMRLLAEGFDKVDYIEACDALTLAPIDHVEEREGRALGAAWLGTTRLIDNVPIAHVAKT